MSVRPNKSQARIAYEREGKGGGPTPRAEVRPGKFFSEDPAPGVVCVVKWCKCVHFDPHVDEDTGDVATNCECGHPVEDHE